MHRCFCFFNTHLHIQVPDKPWSQVSSFLPPRFLPSICIAHSVQQSRWSSVFHWVLLYHALALSACQIVNKIKCQRIYTSMHSGGFELTRLTYARLEDNLIRHRGDRLLTEHQAPVFTCIPVTLIAGLSIIDVLSFLCVCVFFPV